MSGVEDRNIIKEIDLECPECGCDRFVSVCHGYNIYYYNARDSDYYDRGWESYDSERWKCDDCETYVTEDMELEIIKRISGRYE